MKSGPSLHEFRNKVKVQRLSSLGPLCLLPPLKYQYFTFFPPNLTPVTNNTCVYLYALNKDTQTQLPFNTHISITFLPFTSNILLTPFTWWFLVTHYKLHVIHKFSPSFPCQFLLIVSLVLVTWHLYSPASAHTIPLWNGNGQHCALSDIPQEFKSIFIDSLFFLYSFLDSWLTHSEGCPELTVLIIPVPVSSSLVLACNFTHQFQLVLLTWVTYMSPTH